MILLALPAALAASPAFYHPDDIAARSARFGAASEAVGPRFSAAEAKVAEVEAQVHLLELGTAFLGADASEGLHAWTTSNRRALTGQFLLLNRAVGAVQDGFSEAFGAALERALPAVTKGKDVKVCGASGIAAMMKRSTCQGEDLNPALAKAIDADAELAAALDELTARPWPDVRLEPGVQAPVAITGSARTVQLGLLADQLLHAHLQAQDDALEADLEGLQDEVAAKDAAAIAKAGELRAALDRTRGEEGVALRAAVQAALQRGEKKGGPAAVAWCANPEALGGCGLPDATGDVLRMLTADKKFMGEIEALTR